MPSDDRHRRESPCPYEELPSANMNVAPLSPPSSDGSLLPNGAGDTDVAPGDVKDPVGW